VAGTGALVSASSSQTAVHFPKGHHQDVSNIMNVLASYKTALTTL